MPARGWHHDPQVQPHPRDIRGNAVPAPIPIVKVREMVRILGEVSDALESSASGLRYLAHRSTPAPTARSAKLTHVEHPHGEEHGPEGGVGVHPGRARRQGNGNGAGRHPDPTLRGPLVPPLRARPRAEHGRTDPTDLAGIHDVSWRSVMQKAGVSLRRRRSADKPEPGPGARRPARA